MVVLWLCLFCGLLCLCWRVASDLVAFSGCLCCLFCIWWVLLFSGWCLFPVVWIFVVYAADFGLVVCLVCVCVCVWWVVLWVVDGFGFVCVLFALLSVAALLFGLLVGCLLIVLF